MRALVFLIAGCHGAITLEVASDRPVPQGLDTICVGVANHAGGGGQFGRVYALDQRMLPQTLRIEPGSADAADLWVRGDRGGVPVELALAGTDFAGDVTLSLDRCTNGHGALPREVGAPVGPGGALVAASEGQGGTLVLAVAATGAAVIDARGGGLVARDAPLLPAGATAVRGVVAADLDGDCDDDAIVVVDNAPPEVWRREGDHFVDTMAIPTIGAADAVAVADVDRDGDVDVVVGRGAALELWRNDGGGSFTFDGAALQASGRLTQVTALALADLDGDGYPELIVGQAGDPMVAWLGASGSFVPNDALVPPVPLAVERLALVDADGDLDPDLVVTVMGAPMRLYVDRAGALEDQSFVRLPQPAPIAHAAAIASWDDGACEPDAVVAADGGTPTLRGVSGGALAAEMDVAPAAGDVVMIDIDDDGSMDAVLATDAGVQWLAR